MARAGSTKLPALYFRGCDLTAEWLFAKEVLADGHQPGAIPGDRTNFLTPSASLRDRVSKTPSAWGSTKAACQFSWGRGRQAMHLPCKQADAGALPADSTSLRRLLQRAAKAAAPKRSAGGPHVVHERRLRLGKPAKFSTAGRMRFRRASYALPSWARLPPPLPYIGEVIRLPVCKTGVFKQAGSDDWIVTSAFRHLNHQPNQTHDDQPPIAKVAGTKTCQTQTTAQAGDSGTVEAATSAANPAHTKAAIHPLSRRRQPTGLPHPVAPIILP